MMVLFLTPVLYFCRNKCDIIYRLGVTTMVSLLLLIPPVLCKLCCCNYNSVVDTASVVFMSKKMQYYLSLSFCHYDRVVVVVDTAGVVYRDVVTTMVSLLLSVVNYDVCCCGSVVNYDVYDVCCCVSEVNYDVCCCC